MEKRKTQVCEEDATKVSTSDQWNPLNKPCATGHNLPTYRNQVQFCTNFNFPCLKCEQAWRCDAMHKYVRDLPACVWETPLLTWSWWWWWTSSSDTRPTSCRGSGSTTLLCTWGRDTVLDATKTWLQKKESWIISKLAVPSRRMGALLRKRKAPATISTPATAADIVATVHYVVAVCLRNYIFSWCFIALLVWWQRFGILLRNLPQNICGAPKHELISRYEEIPQSVFEKLCVLSEEKSGFKKLCKMSEGRCVFEKLCKMSEVKCCFWKTLQSVRRKTALW